MKPSEVGLEAQKYKDWEAVRTSTKTPRCPHCNSTQVYARVKTKDYHCQKCGKDFTEAKK